MNKEYNNINDNKNKANLPTTTTLIRTQNSITPTAGNLPKQNSITPTKDNSMHVDSKTQTSGTLNKENNIKKK